MAKLTPGTGAISEYAIPSSGSQPLAVTVGPDQNIWFTERGTGKIGKLVW
jgi:streptogramin lyase